MTTTIFLDTETSGTNAIVHGILSFGCVIEVDREIINESYIRIQSGNKVISEDALRINGIDLEEHNKNALTREDAAREIVDLLSRYKGSTLVGHKLSFDLKFLNSLIGSAPWDGLVLYRQIDTLDVLRFLQVAGVITTKGGSLQSIARSLGILMPDEYQSHHALDDAHLTRLVYYGMLRQLDLRGGIYP